MKLGLLRSEYPGVPLMALTATANEKIVNDAIAALGMRNEFRFKSSFNRPNLRYEVRKKDSKTLDEIADYIANRSGDSGVVYCLSRKDCENTSKQLQEKVRERPGCQRIRVSFYHAELDAHERKRRHTEWSDGKVSVLCATVAFGMGIDKPDVRYVIHYSMPKSITHYYQESGRAGRDGDEADCILYYQYKDKKILENLIMKGARDRYSPSTRRQVDQLYSCVQYCEDAFRCRRTMQLEFFGETFDRQNCKGTCDNCRAGREPEQRNMTGHAKSILELMSDLEKQRNIGITINQVAELYRGSKAKSIVQYLNLSSIRGYGAGKQMKKFDIERITHAMIFQRVIVERSEQNKGGFTSDYVNFGENAHPILNGQKQFFVEFPKEGIRLPVEKENKKNTKASRKASNKKTESSQFKATSNTTTEFVSVDSDSDDDTTVKSSRRNSVLSPPRTKALIKKIRELATLWASEERTIKNTTVYYWNILNNAAIKAIAAKTPRTEAELKSLGCVGENIVKDYGSRIVLCINTFLNPGESQGKEHRSKRQRLSPPGESENDIIELDDDIDIAMVDAIVASRH